jgi:arabinogalactan endo-1,4-beta-galactosidase
MKYLNLKKPKATKIKWLSTIVAIFFLIDSALIPNIIEVRATDDTRIGNFNDPLQWRMEPHGNANITINNGLTITSSTKQEFSGAIIYTNWQFIGDFDVQVDFNITGWDGVYSSTEGNPHLDAAAMGIEVEGSIWSINRYMDNPTPKHAQFWRMDYTPAGGSWTGLNWVKATKLANGKFRITRTGTDISFQYYDYSWNTLYKITGRSEPVTILLSSTTIYTSHLFSTTYENFTINAGKTNYIPLVWKDTFPNRTDFYTGGLANDYLCNKIWGFLWYGTDPWLILKENGGGWARVWVTTVHSKDLSETPVHKWKTLPWKFEYWSCQEFAEEILRQAQDRGLRLDLVLFLGDTSNFWGRQNAPASWQGLGVAETCVALEQYAYNTAKYYQSKGLNIEMYEIGNEIQQGILNFISGDRIPLPDGYIPWSNIDYMRNNVWNIESQLLNSCITGLRRVNPNSKIVLHGAGLGVNALHEDLEIAFYQAMVDYGVDFDYAGVTHPYPSQGWSLSKYSNVTWFQHMQNIFSSISGLGKKVIICEAAYPNGDIGLLCEPMPGYPFTPEGQAAWLRDQLLFASNNEDVVGWFYFYFDYFPGLNPDPSMWWYRNMGLLASDTRAQPAVKEFLMGRTPASFELSGLDVDHTQVEVNGSALVSFNVKNGGGVSGVYNAELKLNGVTEYSKRVLLESGSSSTVTFNLMCKDRGPLNIKVGDMTVDITVFKPATIIVRSMQASKSMVRPSEEVTINVIMENTGDMPGNYTLVVSMDGAEKGILYGMVEAGKTTTNTIKLSSTVEGVHTVIAGRKSVTFEVERTMISIPGYTYDTFMVGLVFTVFLLAYRKRLSSKNEGSVKFEPCP